MNKKPSPCYKCKDRTKGCHIDCEKWNKFEKEMKLKKEIEKENREKERVSRDYRIGKG